MIKRKVRLIDTTLQDGNHTVSYSSTVDQVKTVAEGLDRTEMDFIELNHGDGIGGSSINYGFSTVDELTLLHVTGEIIKNIKLIVLLLPGVGTIENLRRAEEIGIGTVRMATHVTEVDISVQHIRYVKSKGLFVVGFLMVSYMAESEEIVKRARIFEAEGIDHINLAGSAGYMLPNDAHGRIAALKESISVPIGFRAHNSIRLAVGNSLTTLEAETEYLGGTYRGLGVGAGNTQMEMLCAVLNRMSCDIHADIYQVMNVTQATVEPLMHRPQTIRADSLVLGYAGVYSSFLPHARRATGQFGADIKDIPIELRRRGMVGGQEDMIVSVAYKSSKNRF